MENDFLGDGKVVSDLYGDEENYDYHQDCFEVGGNFARLILFSLPYTIFVVVMMIVSLILFLWEMVELSRDTSYRFKFTWLFLTLEILTNFAFFLEISLRAVAQQKNYVRYWGNIFDVCIFICSVGATVAFMVSKSWVEQVSEGAFTFLVACRWMVALVRVIVMGCVPYRTRKDRYEKVGNDGIIGHYVPEEPSEMDEKTHLKSQPKTYGTNQHIYAFGHYVPNPAYKPTDHPVELDEDQKSEPEESSTQDIL